MLVYFLRRILLMVPTFFGITLVGFLIINLAPGSPLEQRLQAIQFGNQGVGGGGGGGAGRSTIGVSDDVIQELKRQYGFDKPVIERYWIWLKNISRLDFGESFTFRQPVTDVILSKLPVSLSFGISSLILVYLISVPLGIAKAVRAGTAFDAITGLILYAAYAMPVIVVGIVLIVVFAGGSYFDWFPIGGFQSDEYDSLSTLGKFLDRAHHFVLPLVVYMLGSFTELSILMRNSLLDVIRMDYIRTARAKGLSEPIVLYKHALRNALIPIATGLGGFFGVFLAGSLIIEQMFQLDGIGRLSYASVQARDYNVIMAILFLSSVVLMLGRLFSDLIYVVVDPRIDFK